MPIRIGTAGWSIPGQYKPDFPAEGAHLERYAARFDAVEINSSFYRPHRRATYERWAASVPAGFAFAVKMPKTISHERRLIDCRDPLLRFFEEAAGLGDKLGVLLLQLPPSFAFDRATADDFLGLVGSTCAAPLACEPRHASWFTDEAEALLIRHRAMRVAADPPPVPGADRPGGWRGSLYLRLHGSPAIYRSAYGEARLRAYADGLDGASGWCIFDNTAEMAATGDALRFRALIDTPPERPSHPIV